MDKKLLLIGPFYDASPLGYTARMVLRDMSRISDVVIFNTPMCESQIPDNHFYIQYEGDPLGQFDEIIHICDGDNLQPRSSVGCIYTHRYAMRPTGYKFAWRIGEDYCPLIQKKLSHIPDVAQCKKFYNINLTNNLAYYEEFIPGYVMAFCGDSYCGDVSLTLVAPFIPHQTLGQYINAMTKTVPAKFAGELPSIMVDSNYYAEDGIRTIHDNMDAYVDPSYNVEFEPFAYEASCLGNGGLSKWHITHFQTVGSQLDNARHVERDSHICKEMYERRATSAQWQAAFRDAYTVGLARNVPYIGLSDAAEKIIEGGQRD